MIDREAGGSFRRNNHAGPENVFQEHTGVSNKTIVYLVIIALIVILCAVYVFQLRKARGGQSADPQAAAAATEAAAEAVTGAEAAAEAPAQEETAEAPAQEETAEAPAQEEAAEEPAQEEAAEEPAEEETPEE